MDIIRPYSINSTDAPRKIPVTPDILNKEISSSVSTMFANHIFKRYNPDSLVGRKGIKIYREMKTDDQVKASLSIKKFARLSTPWDIKPADENNASSVEMADFIRYVLKNMKGTFEQDLLNILTAIEFGFSLSEKVFGIYKDGHINIFTFFSCKYAIFIYFGNINIQIYT